MFAGAALGVVYRTLAAFQRHKAGYRSRQADCGAVTLIQRFGSALNLNVHFHLLMPDGVYLRGAEAPVFVRTAAPALPELQALAERIGSRLGKHLERRGILVRDVEDSYLALDPDSEEDALPDLQGHSINYRIALGRRRGQKAFTLQTLAPRSEQRGGERVAQANGFFAARRGGGGSERTRQARALVPLHQPPGGRDGAAVAKRAGSHPLCAEEPVPGRHDTRVVRA
jgi:hypothetical protein